MRFPGFELGSFRQHSARLLPRLLRGRHGSVLSCSENPLAILCALQVDLHPLPLLLPSCGDSMTEERKHAILFAATLLCARKIIDLVDTPLSERMGKKHWLGVFGERSHRSRRPNHGED